MKSDIGQEYINKSDLAGSIERKAGGLASPVGSRKANQVDYLNKSEAEYGRQSTIENRDASEHKHFVKENPAFGTIDDVRSKEENKEFAPQPVEDSSGHSESSEEGIANHQPFSSAFNPVEQVKKVLHAQQPRE